ncbi:MAG: DUF3422 domain-containing protein [Pseudomonadota bacterium]
MIKDNPLRYQMTNELHARPFPKLQTPSRAAFIAIKPAGDGAGRDKDLDRAHLTKLLDRYGVPHPQPGATHYSGDIGKYRLKWESHTEFMTYTVFAQGVAEKPFDGETFGMFPEDWLTEAPGERVTSALIRVEEMADDRTIEEKLMQWFVPESLAASRVVDSSAVVASDFRIDSRGHIRLAVFAKPDIGPRRVGRIVQRLAEIETYKSMSMLGLAQARELTPQINGIEQEVLDLVGGMTGQVDRPEDTLAALLKLAADLENLMAKSSFRFGATGAYSALVNQKIEVLREARIGGRQTLAEFMQRRFEPAMRTVESAEKRLANVAGRAIRAGDLLRTRVDVDRSAQNQKLLEWMDKRADLQLRLQQTVEGLSVVAISYYAVNLALYVFGPVGSGLGLDKSVQAAVVTLPVVYLVWLMVRRIRRKVE